MKVDETVLIDVERMKLRSQLHDVRLVPHRKLLRYFLVRESCIHHKPCDRTDIKDSITALRIYVVYRLLGHHFLPPMQWRH